MYVRHLALLDYRNYATADLPLRPGVTTLVGHNGQGKTNLVEAVSYLSSLSSHRVATDAPLVRAGAERAIVRAAIVRDDREVTIEVEISPGKSNRARLNRAAVKPRDLLGVAPSVMFAPEDLTLVKGDPESRRRFLDDLLVLLAPRFAGVRADYERALRQRNSLLKQLSTRPGRGRRHVHAGTEAAGATAEASLQVWDAQLVQLGSDLLAARLFLIRQLGPHVAESYQTVADGTAAAALGYRGSLDEVVDLSRLTDDAVPLPTRAELAAAMQDRLSALRRQELERGQTLVGPHRDDLVLSLGDLPAKGYASHGESWSIALSLRLASYRLLRRDEAGGDPILILDDVLAELDGGRRHRLAVAIADAEQVLVTAAVPQDIPDSLVGDRVVIEAGTVTGSLG